MAQGEVDGPRPRRRLIPEGLLATVASRAASPAFALLAAALLSRALGPSGYGIYSLAVAVLGVLAIVGGLGLEALTVRSLSGAVHARRWREVADFITWARVVTAVSGTVVIAGVAVACLWNPMGWPDPAKATLLVLVLALLPWLYLRLNRAIFQAFDKTALGVFWEFPFSNFLLVVGAVVLIARDAPSRPEYAAIMHGLTLLLASAAAWMTLPKFPRSTGGRPSFHVDWLRSGVSLSIYIALAYLVQQVDFLVVGTRSTAVEAGLYSVANRLATTLQLVLAPVQQVLISRFARHWSFGETRAASFTARRIGLFGLAGCLPLLLAFLFFGHLVLSIFGPAYGGAAGPLAILTLAQILPLLLGPGLMVLSMIHETRIAVAILAMAVLFDLGLAWFLLPSLGLLGAAVARVVALAIIAIAPYVWLRRRTLLRIAVWDRPSPAEPTRA